MSRSITVAFLRHAATAWSAERRVHADDAPLSPEGEAQTARWRLPADLLRLQAAGRLGWATSPLRRAVETGRRLGAAAPLIDPRLAELDYGDWKGLRFEEVDALTRDTGWDGRPPGGESPAEVLGRVRAWLDERAAQPGPETWIAVTHGGVIRAVLGAALGWDLRPPSPWRPLPERLHRIRRRANGLLQLVTLNELLSPGGESQPPDRRDASGLRPSGRPAPPVVPPLAPPTWGSLVRAADVTSAVLRPPILFYCQHLLGLGHAKRAGLIAHALVKAGEHVLFVTGGLPVPGLDLGGAEVVTLPPLVAADDAASRLARPDGRPPDATDLAERQARLLAVLAERDPAVVLLELFPFGRHALAFELGPLLLAVAGDRARRGRAAARVAVSLRDIVVSKTNQPWYELSVLGVVERWVDQVLVHGSADLIPLDRTFGLAPCLKDRLRYTGYVAAAADVGSPRAPGGEVVISGGGGRVAVPLFHAALDARALAPTAARHPWRLITGPYCPPERQAELSARAAAAGRIGDRPGVVVETFRDDFPALLRGAALSVSQAGYNTVLDVVGSGVPAVVVPYEGSGDEQALRAHLLAERGVLLVVPAGALSPARLAAAMEAALTTPGFPAPARLALDGASRSAAILGALVDEVAGARTAAHPGRPR